MEETFESKVANILNMLVLHTRTYNCDEALEDIMKAHKEEIQQAKSIMEIELRRPSWLTTILADRIKSEWNLVDGGRYTMRVHAIKLMQSTALECGFEITIKDANELMREFCL